MAFDTHVASSLDELRTSYDELYTHGWMKAHANTIPARAMLDLLNPTPGATLLDVACGMGHLLRLASDRGLRTYGVDLSPAGVAQGRQIVPEAALSVGDGERLPWPDNTFDYVTSLGSLEHYMHPLVGMAEIGRVLRPQGRAVILLPNSHDLKSLYHVARYGDVMTQLQEFERFATRGAWEAMLQANGLAVERVGKFNGGYGRVFRRGNEAFFIIYNSFYRLLGQWIPVNLSDSFIFVCRKQT